MLAPISMLYFLQGMLQYWQQITTPWIIIQGLAYGSKELFLYPGRVQHDRKATITLEQCVGLYKKEKGLPYNYKSPSWDYAVMFCLQN